MATIKINNKYSATYTIEKAAKGFVARGEIWKGDKQTRIYFSAAGNTRQAAADKVRSEAGMVCPDD